jgi:GT2 family glycosyltransferase
MPPAPPHAARAPRTPRVAAVVVNYNGFAVTRDALLSLRRMDYPAFDLMVVDNGSTDDSAAHVAEEFPDLRQERVAENRGSSAGYAFGFQWAFANGYDYVLLLNNDIEVEPDLLSRLVEVAESDPSIGCVGPKCYYFDRRRHLWSAGGRLRFRESITHERGYKELDRGQFDADSDVDYVNGCAILIKRGAAEAAGGWDPLFFICVDDADFCTRVKAKGFRCVYAHRAVLYHRVAFSTGGYTAGRNFQFGRSSAIYVRRYASFWQKSRYFAFTVAAFLAAYLRELPRGNQKAALAKLLGVREGFRLRLSAPPALAEVPLSPSSAHLNGNPPFRSESGRTDRGEGT